MATALRTTALLRHASLALTTTAAVAVFGIGCASSSRVPAKSVSVALEADNGQLVDTRKLRGKVVILHVFATWSMPSSEDAIALDREFGSDDRVVVLGVALDEEAPQLIGAWKRGTGIAYSIGFATDEIRAGRSALGEATAIPFTVVIDRAGKELYRHPTSLGEAGIEEIRRRGELPIR